MQAIRRVDVRKPPEIINLATGSSIRGKDAGKRRGIATAIVATSDVADLLHEARGKPELGHVEVERISRSKKTVPDWDLEQEQEPLDVFGLQVIDFDPSESTLVEKKIGKRRYKTEWQYPADPLWSVPVVDVRRLASHFQKLARGFFFW
jgi:hypothetical protein